MNCKKSIIGRYIVFAVLFRVTKLFLKKLSDVKAEIISAATIFDRFTVVVRYEHVTLASSINADNTLVRQRR